MTFTAKKLKADRRPNVTVALLLDKCSRTYSVAPCTAPSNPGGECYNSFQTCVDPANYDPSTTLVVRLGMASADIYPLATSTNSGSAIPCIEKIDFAPVKITPGKGLGYRANIAITCLDFPHHDIDYDPYVANRNYIATDQGTFWSKLLARNPHFTGRRISLFELYTDDTRDANQYKQRDYIIDRIEGPDKSGKIKIIAKDMLALAESLKAECPTASVGTLSADLASGTTSTFSLNTGEGSPYPSGEHVVRINSELIRITSRTSDTFTIAERGYGGTTADDHSADDTVQLCYWRQGGSGDKVDLVLADLLENYAGIDASYIDSTTWAAERTEWINGYQLETIISTPTPVQNLLDEICVETNVNIWWSDLDQDIKFKVEAPTFGALSQINDADLLEKSTEVISGYKERISQIQIYYNVRNWTEDRTAKNYKNLKVSIDSDSESANGYNQKAIKKIFCRWLQNETFVAEVASRFLSRFKREMYTVRGYLDYKDYDFMVGQHFELNTNLIQNYDGSTKSVEFQMLSMQPENQAQRIKFEALQFSYEAARRAAIGPTGLADYLSATGSELLAYSWICSSTGFNMSDGGDPWVIV